MTLPTIVIGAVLLVGLLGFSLWCQFKWYRYQIADAGGHPRPTPRISHLMLSYISVFLVIGVLLLVTLVDSLNRPENSSFETLLADVGGPRHFSSWPEIKHRLGLGQISEAQKQELLNRCLQVAEANPARGESYEPACYVMDAIRSQQLSPKRAERFFTSLLTESLIVSPAEAGPDNTISYKLNLAWKLVPGSLSCYAQIEPRSFVIDDRPSAISCGFLPSNDPRPVSHLAALPFGEPGWHTITLPLRVTIYDSTRPPEDARHVVFRGTITVPGNRFHIQGTARTDPNRHPVPTSKPRLSNQTAAVAAEPTS
jgi:hypothetical protein